MGQVALVELGQDSSQDGERKRVDPIHSQLELYLKLWGPVGPICLGKQKKNEAELY